MMTLHPPSRASPLAIGTRVSHTGRSVFAVTTSGEHQGDQDDGILILSLLATEAWLEERGWDSPPLVLALIAQGDDEAAPSGSSSTQTLAYAVIGEGEPYEILANGFVPDALAILVAAEAWGWPEDLPDEERLGRPSHHPRRVELRTVLAVTRARTVLSVTRARGSEPVVDVGGTGPLIDAMGRALGVIE